MVRLLMTALLFSTCGAQVAHSRNGNENNIANAAMSLHALESCYVGSLREVPRNELMGYTITLRKMKEDAERRQPGLDTNLLEMDGRREPHLFNRSIDPAPWVCHAARMTFNRLYWLRFPDKCAALCGCDFVIPEMPTRADVEKLNRRAQVIVGLDGVSPDNDAYEIKSCEWYIGNARTREEAKAECEERLRTQEARKAAYCR